jgi:hypothetical protein
MNGRLLGRLSSGLESDTGKLIHSLKVIQVKSPRLPDIMINVTISLCGQKPGRKSVGWEKTELDITCPRCLKKINMEVKK